MKQNLFTLKGEIKDQPIADTGDWELYLDYSRRELERILDEICDIVNDKYPECEDRFKVTISITIDKESDSNNS